MTALLTLTDRRFKGLDVPAWSSLTTHHAHLADRLGALRAYPERMAHFAAADPNRPQAVTGLDRLLGPRAHAVTFMQANPVTIPESLVCTDRAAGVQMILHGSIEEPRDHSFAALTPFDVPEMQKLVALTEPGPFETDTILFGSYWGIRRNGQLVAMAGQRLHLDGFCEISAVCVHPEHRGHGYARSLVARVAGGILAQNETPFLHTYAANAPAIALYAKLGFRLYQQMHIECLDLAGRASMPPVQDVQHDTVT